MDRKAAIRDYKNTPRPMGVYAIRHVASGRLLVGTSVDLPSILNRERVQLRLGAHPNRALQADWRELGEAGFSFEVLDTLTPPETPGYDPAADLAALGALWLEKLTPWDDRGYNRKPRDPAG